MKRVHDSEPLIQISNVAFLSIFWGKLSFSRSFSFQSSVDRRLGKLEMRELSSKMNQFQILTVIVILARKSATGMHQIHVVGISLYQSITNRIPQPIMDIFLNGVKLGKRLS